MAKIARADAQTHQFKWKFLIGGLASIVVGYVALAMGSITVAPILLVLGYCVLVPLSFL